ncbi:MAG: hypothetical protein LBR64_02735 [Dysgonamonadaceae bacterium]|jgi:hypothetical protein|nr:hypothetical protein [Dysgonamonadaceae bacterium]
MDITALNTLITRKIAESIPEGEKPIHWIVENMDIAKESAYRRLRGEIAYQLDELCFLSQKLNFSVDEIFHSVADFGKNGENGPLDELEVCLMRYVNFQQNLAKEASPAVMMTANTIRLYQAAEFENLFRFLYFRYKYKRDFDFACPSFGKLVMPEIIEDCRVKIAQNRVRKAKLEFIISKNLVTDTIDEIRYFRNCNKMTVKESDLIKSDLKALLDKMERQMKTGMDANGNETVYYLSLLNVEHNTLVGGRINETLTQKWDFDGDLTLIPVGENRLEYHKWFNNQKRYASLITLSNEIVKLRFLDRQRQYIDEEFHDWGL